MKSQLFTALFALLLFNAAKAQELNCLYVHGTIDGVPSYFCYLVANNQLGLDNITRVGGEHVANFTDTDVVGVFSLDGATANLPTVICRQFPNLVFLDLTSLQISTVAANAIGGCTQLEFLRFYNNSVPALAANFFANNSRLTYIDLDRNQLTTLPENVFAGLVNVDMLELRNNPFQLIPDNLFRPLVNLEILYLQNTRLTQLNAAWLAGLSRLVVLTVYNNNITQIAANTFASVPNLRELEISRNPLGPTGIHVNAFQPLTNLVSLFIAQIDWRAVNTQLLLPLRNLRILFAYWNGIETVPAGTFANLTGLWALDLGVNLLDESTIAPDAFDPLRELVALYLDDNYIEALEPRWFANLHDVTSLFLDFNFIPALPAGIFAPFRALQQIHLWYNDIKTVDRNAFGDLSALTVVDLDQNVVNSVEESFFRDSLRLNVVYFWQNLCASVTIYGFVANRDDNIERFRRCLDNHGFVIDAETDGVEDFQFFPGRHPGIQLRVQTTEQVEIALTPFDFAWTPMLEVIIGAANNTRSVIRRNRETDVVTVPTPGILRAGQWNGFRISWANHAVLVFREGDEWPFMGFTMADFFPVNFYGLRSPLGRATWTVQPIG